MSNDDQEQETEVIESDDVITRDSVSGNDDMKVRWALWISGIALGIGVVFLVVGICKGDAELRTWSTGLISLVVGAALGYAFSGGRA